MYKIKVWYNVLQLHSADIERKYKYIYTYISYVLLQNLS